MRLRITGKIAAGAVLACAAGPAAAMQCYTVLDRSDNVVYRGTVPPIDLSDKGIPEREAMRQRGQHMIAMDADRCPGVEFFTGTAGSPSLSVETIVGGIQPLQGRSPAGNEPNIGFRTPPPAAPMTPQPKKSSSY